MRAQNAANLQNEHRARLLIHQQQHVEHQQQHHESTAGATSNAGSQNPNGAAVGTLEPPVDNIAARKTHRHKPLPLSGMPPLAGTLHLTSESSPGAENLPLQAGHHHTRSDDAGGGALSPVATENTPLLPHAPHVSPLLPPEPNSPTSPSALGASALPPPPPPPPPTSASPSAMAASLASPRPRERDAYPSAPPFSGNSSDGHHRTQNPDGPTAIGPSGKVPGGTGVGGGEKSGDNVSSAFSGSGSSGGASNVDLSGQTTVAGCRVVKYLGAVTLHFIKEHFGVRSEQEVSSFFLTFLLEAQAMVRAHTAALGANALVCYSATPEESQGGRNQVYHMMTVSYFFDARHDMAGNVP